MVQGRGNNRQSVVGPAPFDRLRMSGKDGRVSVHRAAGDSGGAGECVLEEVPGELVGVGLAAAVALGGVDEGFAEGRAGGEDGGDVGELA
jgi:hypothetical protein